MKRYPSIQVYEGDNSLNVGKFLTESSRFRLGSNVKQILAIPLKLILVFFASSPNALIKKTMAASTKQSNEKSVPQSAFSAV